VTRATVTLSVLALAACSSSDGLTGPIPDATAAGPRTSVRGSRSRTLCGAHDYAQQVSSVRHGCRFFGASSA